MKKNLLTIPVVILLGAMMAAGAQAQAPVEPDALYQNAQAPTAARINDLLGRMTLEEKIALLYGDPAAGTSLDTAFNPRLGIPRFNMTDGPHGASFSKHWNQGATAFPVGVNLGSTWNPALLRQVGVAIGEETLAQGRNVILGPCLDIQRTPTRGRNFESYSEDPYLMARLGVAYINGVQSMPVAACAKHFVANTQEWHRMYVSAEVDERALREIHLYPFRAAVQEANVLFVMSAYNKLNGQYCSENHWLLTGVLKQDWGFPGAVVSDWGAVHSTVPSALAGLDIEMGGTTYLGQPLLEAVQRGEVAEPVIDDKVRRILYVMITSGIFDQPFRPRANAEELYKQPEPMGLFAKSMYGLLVDDDQVKLDSPQHRALALQAARESLVLLKNKRDALPLLRGQVKRVAVFGPNAYRAYITGGGSAEVKPTYQVSALEGILKEAGADVQVDYYRGVNFDRRYNVPNVPQQFFRPVDAEPGQTGLTAEYFNNRHLAGEPAVKRIDGQVFFHYSGGEPAPGVNPHDFSVRWTGRITVPETGRYRFYIHHHGAFYANEFGDGARLFIDGRELIDNWDPTISEVPQAEIALEAGTEYDFRMEYHDAPGEKKLPIVILGWRPARGELEEAARRAAAADAAVVCVGYNQYYEGENNDRGSMYLPVEQEELIRAVARANDRTIVVLFNGGAVLMGRWLDDVEAVLEAWYPGQEGGRAIAEALFGTMNPSGRLPLTFGLRREDYPDWGNYPGDGVTVNFAEGIYVGYRHFEKQGIAVQYPFGHGLSYTSFDYDNLKMSSRRMSPGETVEVTVQVTNRGPRVGSEVVQLYLRDVKASVDKPIKELKGFVKVSVDPGAQQTVRFALTEADLSYYDVERQAWVAEPGAYEVLVGASSQDIRLRGKFTLAER